MQQLELFETKRCPKCGIPKSFEGFTKDRKRKDGLNWQCRVCVHGYYLDNHDLIRQLQNERRLIHYWSHHEEEKAKALKATKNFQARHRDKVLARRREIYWENPEKQRKYLKERRAKRGDEYKEKAREYDKNHRERALLLARQRRRNDPDKYRAKDRRERSTVIGRINHRMSTAIRLSLKGNKAGRRWESLVGYTLAELREWLENHFTQGMSWEAFMSGDIHIDHIIPRWLFTFATTDDPQFRACWALSNLQPLWAQDNLMKNNKVAPNSQLALL